MSPYTEPLKSNPRPHKQLFMAEFNIILPWTLKYSKVSPKFRPHEYRSQTFSTSVLTKGSTNFDIFDLLNQTLSMPIFKYPFLVTFPVLGSTIVTEDKGKFVSVYAMKARGSRGLAPLILNLGARRRRVTKFTFRPLLSKGNPRYPLNMRVGGPHSRSVRCKRENSWGYSRSNRESFGP